VTAYRKAVLAQTEAWVNGFSYHSQETNECCPDFSCCVPDMFEKDASKRADRLQDLQQQYGLIQ
jgi:hypothetical protein